MYAIAFKNSLFIKSKNTGINKRPSPFAIVNPWTLFLAIENNRSAIIQLCIIEKIMIPIKVTGEDISVIKAR